MNEHQDLHRNFCLLTINDRRQVIGWINRRLLARKIKTVYLPKFLLGSAMVYFCLAFIIVVPLLFGGSAMLTVTGIGLLASCIIYGEFFVLIGKKLEVG